jgi:hypothetical protein
MHEIVGFAGTTETLLRLRKRWRHARIYRLRRSCAYSFMPIPDEMTVHEEESDERSVPNSFESEAQFGPNALQMFAPSSAGSALVWLRTMYYGGGGYQAGILWGDGVHIFGPEIMWDAESGMPPRAEFPINRALRELGVTPDGDNDEFSMFGLSGYRTCRHIVDEAQELLPPPE